MYGWSQYPYGGDHCRPCSRGMRADGLFPGDGRNECSCHYDCPDKKVHLCTNCRVEQRDREHQRRIREIRNLTKLHHMHRTWEGDNCDRDDATNIEHFIRQLDYVGVPRNGDSSCICGKNDKEKVLSYEFIKGELDFLGMVRLCMHCQREMFVVDRHFEFDTFFWQLANHLKSLGATSTQLSVVYRYLAGMSTALCAQSPSRVKERRLEESRGCRGKARDEDCSYAQDLATHTNLGWLSTCGASDTFRGKFQFRTKRCMRTGSQSGQGRRQSPSGKLGEKLKIILCL